MRPVDFRVAVFLRLVALFTLALARVVAFLPVERARLVTFLAPALARVVAFLPVERARLVTFLAPALARVVAFLPLVAAFFVEARVLRAVFLAAPPARVDTFFPVAGARFTTFLVSGVALSTISPAGSATRSGVSHERSGGGSGDGAGCGAGSGVGSPGVSGAPPHGEVYPSLLGSSTSYMATSFPCLRSMLLRFLDSHVVNQVYGLDGTVLVPAGRTAESFGHEGLEGGGQRQWSQERSIAARRTRGQSGSSAWTTSQGMTAYGSGVTKRGQYASRASANTTMAKPSRNRITIAAKRRPSVTRSS